MQVMSFFGHVKVALCHISIFSVNISPTFACKGRWLWLCVKVWMSFISPLAQ
ncbi:hypothetical protein CSK29544_01210 [Cronobacter sakazakii]|nr:hypothetical protein CSK29544_01210 [Cronobacter sakazakii]